LANGSTTIDKQGAVGGCLIDVVVAATVAGSVEEDLVPDQPHHATTARTSAAKAAAATGHGRDRRCRGARAGILATGNSAIASGRNAKTRTDRAKSKKSSIIVKTEATKIFPLINGQRLLLIEQLQHDDPSRSIILLCGPLTTKGLVIGDDS